MARKTLGLWLAVAAILLAGGIARGTIFRYPANETDEIVYLTLAHQLATGGSYTLQNQRAMVIVPEAMYGGPVFFHPPFGPFLFSVLGRLGGVFLIQAGQLALYFLFVLSNLGCLLLIFPRLPKIALLAFALVCAFTPIFAHTSMKVGIDKPRLAFFSLHFLLVLWACRKGGASWWLLAFASSLAPVFTKVDSLSAYPFAYAIAFLCSPESRRPLNLRILASFFALNFAVALGWLAYADVFHYGPGRPPPEQIRDNHFLWYVTEHLSSLGFVREYLEIVATVLPSAVVALAFRKPGAERRIALVLLLWIAGHVAFFALLGAFGYTKLHRHLIMTVPATTLLFAYACGQVADRLRSSPRALLWVAGAALAAGCTVEAAQGLSEILVRPKFALIFPLRTGIPD